MSEALFKRGPAYVFIGSSSEGIRIAEAIHDGLEACRIEDTNHKLCRVHVWDEIFKPSDIVIDRLLVDSRAYDYAIIVITPDDVTISRRKKEVSPRDNLNFEIGLFMATLGRKYCVVVKPNNIKIKIPSDLLGMCTVNYEFVSKTPKKGDMRPTINEIRAHIEEIGLRDQSQDFMNSWGYSFEQKKFGLVLNEDKIFPYGNGDNHFVFGCVAGDKAEVFENPVFSLSKPWRVPRPVQREPTIIVDCESISSGVKVGDFVWGLMFLVDSKFNPKKVTCLDDIISMGGRLLDGKGNMVSLRKDPSK